MPATVNNTGQNNLLLFEVVRVRRTVTALGKAVTTVKTLAVHPLVIAPHTWRWTDTSRSAITETAGRRTVHTKSGRALRVGSFQGTFGVAPAGLGPYMGDGETRRKRFYNEVVRLSDALTSEEVEDALDTLTGTPQLPFLLTDYNPETDLFAVNLYDIWHDIAMEVQIQRWETTRTVKSADGRTEFTLTVREAGPLVVGHGFSVVLSKLMSGLVAWDDANGRIKSSSVEDFLNANANVLGIAANGVSDLMDGVRTQVDAATRLFSGDTRGSLSSVAANEGINNMLANAAQAEQALEDLATTFRRQGVGTSDFGAPSRDPTPQVREDGDVYFLPGVTDIPDLSDFDSLTGMLDSRDGLRQQGSMGRLFGMSDREYESYLGSGGLMGQRRPEVKGSVTHTTSITDTPESLEATYSVGFDRILEVNAMTPDEALLPGTKLDIPIPRSSGPQTVDGLPTFGSHVGEDAWGEDIGVDFDLDDDGDLVTLAGSDLLIQGAAILIADIENELLSTVQGYDEDVQRAFLTKRVSGELSTDERIKQVTQVDIGGDGRGGLGLRVTLQAINGVTVRTGGP